MEYQSIGYSIMVDEADGHWHLDLEHEDWPKLNPTYINVSKELLTEASPAKFPAVKSKKSSKRKVPSASESGEEEGEQEGEQAQEEAPDEDEAPVVHDQDADTSELDDSNSGSTDLETNSAAGAGNASSGAQGAAWVNTAMVSVCVSHCRKNAAARRRNE